MAQERKKDGRRARTGRVKATTIHYRECLMEALLMFGLDKPTYGGNIAPQSTWLARACMQGHMKLVNGKGFFVTPKGVAYLEDVNNGKF